MGYFGLGISKINGYFCVISAVGVYKALKDSIKSLRLIYDKFNFFDNFLFFKFFIF